MNATKILWGQVFVVTAVVLAFVWAATEWTAWRLAFQPQLGRPWFVLFGWPVYQPPAFFWWWFAYDAYARELFVEGAYIAASSGVAAIVWLSSCRYGAPARPRRSRPMVLRDGQRPVRSDAPGCFSMTAFCSASGTAPIFAMMGPSFRRQA